MRDDGATRREATSSAIAVADVTPVPRIPRATYRMQFGAGWTFEDARRTVRYLAALGVSHVYASPLQRARPGSHGYDIVDHGCLDPVLGTRDDFNRFTDELRSHGMGLVVDVVPNHMGIGGEYNRWWLDVLEHGPASRYANYFDIDWDPATSDIVNKVLLPILEDQFGVVLEDGKLTLVFAQGAFTVRYYDHVLPVAPGTYGGILRDAIELARSAGAGESDIEAMDDIASSAERMPPPDIKRPMAELAELRNQGELLKQRLGVIAARPPVEQAINAAVRALNGTSVDPRSYDRLDALLARQSYRPAYWRVASEEINYRRFFDINDLAAIRVERDDVFDDTHRLIFDLIEEGRVQGLRVDHPDGLREPQRYFERLQEAYRERCPDGGLIRRGSVAHDPPLYVVGEKILSEGETLPDGWNIHGTTGYDFLNDVNGIFVDPRKRAAMDRVYEQFVGPQPDFSDLENATKKMIMLVSFAGEVNTLGHLLDRIASDNRRYRDFTRNALIFAIREIIACLTVYRTYISEAPVPPRDRAYIEAAVRAAKRRNPRTAASLFDFVGETLLLDNVPSFPEEDLARLRDFVLRFQQITGPVMAKGVEDTAFYIYNRLTSLNEVGGDPGRYGSSVQTLHMSNALRTREWPQTLTTTATHDTKRGEDVRATINVLSEMPAEWRAAVMRWREMNLASLRMIDGEECPSLNDQYLLYQTLVGAWPQAVPDDSFAARIGAYMQKATKEAKVHTSWVNPNGAYDDGVQSFVREILSNDAFVADISAFARHAAFFGRINSLSQLAIKLGSPGVPDVYQGTELWDLSLVDPDNRRPVDYECRMRELASVSERVGDGTKMWHRLGGAPADPCAKMRVMSEGLRMRSRMPRLFAEGAYHPLDARGARQRHVVAFGRADGASSAIVVAPRLVRALLHGHERLPIGHETWGETTLRLPAAYASTTFRNVLSDEVIKPERAGRTGILRVSDALRTSPVALLASQ